MTTAAHTRLPESDDVEAVVEAAAQRARTWLTVTEDKHDASTEQLAALLRDEDGVAFTMDFVDRVMRPEDDKVAADALQAITEKFDPAFLGRFNGLLIGMGGFSARSCRTWSCRWHACACAKWSATSCWMRNLTSSIRLWRKPPNPESSST